MKIESKLTKSPEVKETVVHKNPVNEAKSMTGQQLKALEALEAREIPGAPSRLPKAELLRADEAQASASARGKHIRWISLSNKEKLAVRLSEGYTRVASEHGGKQLGDQLALFEIPQARADARVKREEQNHKQRLTQHKADMEKVIVNMARELRDNHGITIDERRLFVDE